MKSEIYTMQEVKAQLYQHCSTFVNDRVNAARKAIEEAQESADTESKSSVGDKYETGRTMIQLEIEKHNTQLVEALKLKQVLEQIDPEKRTDKAEIGSLVVTNQGKFYIAISAGQIRLGEETFFAVSGASPIGSKLIGLKRDDSFMFNAKQYKVRDVY